MTEHALTLALIVLPPILIGLVAFKSEQDPHAEWGTERHHRRHF